MLFSPGTVIANDLPQPETAPVETPATTAITETPTTPVGTGTPAPAFDVKGLMEAINADRESREAKVKSESDRESYKKRAEDAEKQLADLDKAKKNRLLDPAGFLRKMGYTDKELALTSEGIMFALMPDKAPADHLAKLVLAQREQDRVDAEEKDKQREATEAQRRAEGQVAAERDLEARYVAALKRDVTTLTAGTYPASQAWFADDHDGYTQELFATARTLAEEASKAGKSINMTTAGIAPYVEKKYADRAKRLAGILTPTQSPKTTQLPKQPATSLPEETKEEPSVGTGTTSNHKLSEKEIIERATRAAFGMR